MQKALYKKSKLEGLFTDYKHHSSSWRNSKKMRSKRERKMLNKEMLKEREANEQKKSDA